MKTYIMNISNNIASHSFCLFLGIILMLLFPLSVKAEPDYGKEIIMVSMGDSYSSGEGIPPFYGPSTLEEKVKDEDWLAHRSKKSWSGQLRLKGLDQEMKLYKVDLKDKEKSQENIGKWYFVASSGALTEHIFDKEQNKPYYRNRRKGTGKGSIRILKKDKNPLPKQAEIFESINTDEVDYITLTLGGNDVGFTDVVKACAMHVTFDEPNGLYNQLKLSLEKLDDVSESLSEVYEELWEKIGKQGNIIVAGYPQLVAMEGGISKKVFGFDNAEATAVNVTVSVFNDAIEKKVLEVQKDKHANIYFVSVEDAFIDHGAYEDEAYIKGIEIPSNDEDLEDGISSDYSMHPNEKGAEAYAACVQETIDWIEAGKPSITVSGQVVDENNQPAGNLTVTIRTEKAGKKVFQETTDENGKFSGDIKLTTQDLHITVSNEEEKLIDAPVAKKLEYGNNDLGKIKLNNYNGTMVVEINDQESIDKDTINALYEQTIADYDKMMHEGQLSYREKNRDTYEEADRYTYYTIVDIDGNGVDELILRFDHQNVSHWTNQDSGYGESTYIYTFKDGEVVNVLLPNSSTQGFTPDFVHLGFTKIYKGTNLINRGMYHMPQDDIFYSYQDGILSENPVLVITRGDDTWLIDNEEKTSEECIEAYNTASNNDEGYELQRYEIETDTQKYDSGTLDLIEKYKSFIHTKNNSYRIYDIDKDGFPELFFSEMHYDEREAFTDIYTYVDGEFQLLDRTYDFIFWQAFPTYASYPDGNGIVQYGWGKGREIITVETWDEGVNKSEDFYVTNFLTDKTKDKQIYYTDTCDDEYDTEINHQFYQSDTSNPYFEGSYLLAYSAADNYTAVYEAFDVSDDVRRNNSNETTNVSAFPGVISLTVGDVKAIQSKTGDIYHIQYEDLGNNDDSVDINLHVNDHVESFHLDAIYWPYIENVYVTDINTTDSYSNIVVVIGGEDDESSTYLFAYNKNEICEIANFKGRLVSESVTGDGSVLLVFWLGMSIQGYGSFTVHPEITIYNLNAQQETLHSGRTVYSDEGNYYEDGFVVVTMNDVEVYEDSTMSLVSGVIPAGSNVSCEYTDEYINEPYGTVFHINNGEVEGYVTSRFFKECCNGVRFAG